MKRKIADMNDVAARIKQLESIQEEQLESIKVSFREIGTSLSPKNLLKGALQSVIASPGLRTTAIDTAVSASAGLLGRKLITRGSRSVVRKLAGTAVQFILSNFVRTKCLTSRGILQSVQTALHIDPMMLQLKTGRTIIVRL